MQHTQEVATWSLFVQYPNREQVCRDVVVPRSLQELRNALEVFDDQQILAQHCRHTGTFSLLENIKQLFDGAVLRITVPRRRIFVNLGSLLRDKAVVWYPGATAIQIEKAIVKACGLPLGTPIELLDGDVAVVISATIPDDSSFTVVPFFDKDGALTNGGTMRSLDRSGSSSVGRPDSVRRNGAKGAFTPPTSGIGRSPNVHSGVNRGSSREPPNAVSSRRSRSATPQGRAAFETQSRPRSRGASPTRSANDLQHGEGPAMPSGRISSPDEHCVHILAGHGGFVFCLTTVGDVLFTGSQDSNIMIWDLNNLQYIGTLPGHKGFVKSLTTSFARKLLFSGSQDKTIKVWSLDTFSAVKTLFGHNGEVNDLVIIDSLQALISSSEDRSIRVWDLSSFTALATLDAVHLGGIFSLALVDDQTLLSGSRDRSIKVWNTTSWQSLRTLHPPHYDGVTALVASSQQSGHFYSASRDKSIKRWEVHGFEHTNHITHAHGDWLTSLAITNSDQVLFSGSKDCIVKVWDSNLRCQDHLLGHKGAISALKTINGHLFSASHDRTVRVWKIDQYEN